MASLSSTIFARKSTPMYALLFLSSEHPPSNTHLLMEQRVLPVGSEDHAFVSFCLLPQETGSMVYLLSDSGLVQQRDLRVPDSVVSSTFLGGLNLNSPSISPTPNSRPRIRVCLRPFLPYKTKPHQNYLLFQIAVFATEYLLPVDLCLWVWSGRSCLSAPSSSGGTHSRACIFLPRPAKAWMPGDYHTPLGAHQGAHTHHSWK